MPDHYYTASPSSPHDERAIDVAALGVTARFFTDAGVFSRDGLDPGTRLLLESLPEPDGPFLDLCCGWGAVGVLVGLRWPGAQITMTDVNERACGLARRALKENRVAADVRVGDGFEAVEGTFSVIAVNPPIRAGKAVIYRLFDEAVDRLRQGGRLYVVIRKQQGAKSALAHLQSLAPTAVVARNAGYWVLETTKPAA